MSAQSTSTLRYVGNVPTTLADGRPIEPGEYVKLTQDEIANEYNANLLQLNQLIAVDDKDAAGQEELDDSATEQKGGKK